MYCHQIWQIVITIIVMLRWVFESVRYGQRNAEVRKLLEQNFQSFYNLRDNNGCTILHIAADRSNIELLSYLLSLFDAHAELAAGKGEWIDQPDDQGSTAMHYAAFRGCLQSVELLSSHGANLRAVNAAGLNCVHFAAQGGSALLIYYFKERGLSIHWRDQGGSAALHWAAYTGMDMAVAALMSWGADYDLVEGQGMSPLHHAVLSGKAKVVTRLLMAGCDRDIRNNKGQRAVDLAQQLGYDRIVTVLKSGECSERNCLRPRVGKSRKRGGIFFMSITTLMVTLCLNAFIIYPFSLEAITFVALAALGMGFIASILFFSLHFSDPGVVPLGKNEGQAYLKLLKENVPKQICYECGIKKPKRSRHCYICGKCVRVFDHHCPWIANCIGCNNTLLFTVSVGIAIIYLILTLVSHILYLTSFSYDTITSLKLGKIVAGVAALIVSGIAIVLLMVLLVRQLHLSALGLTVFEKYLSSINPKKSQIQLKERKKMQKNILLLKRENSSTSGQPSRLQELIEKQIEGETGSAFKADYWKNCVKMFYENRFMREYGWQE